MTQLLWAPLLHKLQDMPRNRGLFISELGNIQGYCCSNKPHRPNTDGIFSALKRVKIYLMSTMEKKRLHAVMMVLVHNNILLKLL